MRGAKLQAAATTAFALTVGATVLTARTAHCYCRATTCDPELESCPVDDNGCPLLGPPGGLPLYWPSLCITFSVQRDGSARRGISSAAAEATLTRAFQAWLSADCGNGSAPSFGIVPFGATQCDQAEFAFELAGTGPSANANILIFRDDSWPYGATEIDVARTTLTFDVTTGALYDADIEVNSFEHGLTVDANPAVEDLQTILTHEAGHFLGLAHSEKLDATMYAEYPLDDLGYRTLSPDDSQGICSLYPPTDAQQSAGDAGHRRAVTCPPSTFPLQGFSTLCVGEQRQRPASGCTLQPDAPTKRGYSVLLLAACALILRTSSRSKRRLVRPNWG